MSIKGTKSIAVTLAAIIAAAAIVPVFVWALNIDSTDKYAWGENIGWINFGTTEGDVDVSTSGVDGYAWGENVGWISLTCSNTSSCGSVNFGISRTGAALSGYAWGENVGWISFACENTSSCGVVDYGVEIDSGSGEFSGYAWGENVGWINFNCSNDASCGVVDFKVKTSATATPTPTSSSAPGIPPIALGSPPVPTPTPSFSTSPSPSPIPSPSASATPIATPTTTPPVSTPPTSPNPTPPAASPAPDPIDIIGRGIDSVGEFIFGGLTRLLRGIGDACDDSVVQAGACGSAALSALITIIGLLAMLLQQEFAAATFSLLQAVGLKKRARVWGTIYDAQSKRPIPLVKAELIDAAGRVLETRYADRDGRYGFLLSPSMLHAGEQVQISIRTEKPGYHFPSSAPISGTDYFVYDNVYQGGPVAVRSDSALTFNIPMDSIGSFRSSFSGFGRSLTGPVIDRILNIGFYAGLVLVPLNLYLVPNTKNLIILVVFLFANLFRLLAHFRPYGTTVDAGTGERLPFALVTLNDESGKRVAFAVSDEFGRYILSAERGQEYEMVAHTPANVSPQRETRERIRLKSGWMTNTIVVGKSSPASPQVPPPRPPAQMPSTEVDQMSRVSGLTLSLFFALFAIGFAGGRPRLPIGAFNQGVDEAYVLLHPQVATISEVLRDNTPIIEILATIATATVVAGAVLAAREAFRNWVRGRRGMSNGMTHPIGTTAFVLGAIVVPMTYFFNPSLGRAVIGILFLGASAVWAHTKRISHL